jgi:hypothetical protein
MRLPAALFVLLLLPGCLFRPPTDTCDGPNPPPGCFTGPVYPERLDHPDSLLEQLAVAYARREIDPYAALLARDFVFRFQESEVPEFGEELGFESDSTYTRNMFASPDVREIRLSLTGAPPDTALWEGEEMLRVVLVDLQLDVDLVNGVTLRVSNQTQHYYFQWGRPAMGEDPGRYYIRAWRDIGTPAGAPGGTVEPAGTAVREASWGSLREAHAPVESAPANR